MTIVQLHFDENFAEHMIMRNGQLPAFAGRCRRDFFPPYSALRDADSHGSIAFATASRHALTEFERLSSPRDKLGSLYIAALQCCCRRCFVEARRDEAHIDLLPSGIKKTVLIGRLRPPSHFHFQTSLAQRHRRPDISGHAMADISAPP